MTRKQHVLALACFVGAALLFSPIGLADGNDKDKDKDRVLSKIVFIHYKKGHAKPPWAGGGKDKEDDGDYTYLAKSTRWRTAEDFLLNPANGESLSESQVKSAFTDGMGEWETYADAEIFNDVSFDTSVTYDGGDYRGYNTLSFGDLGDTGVIGETTVWGYFGGKPSDREIIEAHVVLNDHYVWGDADSDSDVMDVLNIVTHEVGHVAGMGDLYDSGASEETMYGYSGEGETKKRDLYTGDIEGISKLYM